MLAPGPGEALADLAGQFGVELRVLAAGADEPLGDLARHRRRERAGGGDPDRHLVLGLVVDRRVLGAIELALEGDPVLGPQFVDQRDRLAQPVAPLLGARPFDADRRHLVQRLASADAEHDAAWEHGSERAEDLGDDRRVIAKGRGQDARADRHPPGASAERAEPGKRRRRMPVGVLPRLEMVADKDRVRTRPPRPGTRSRAIRAGRTVRPTPCIRASATAPPLSVVHHRGTERSR